MDVNFDPTPTSKPKCLFPPHTHKQGKLGLTAKQLSIYSNTETPKCFGYQVNEVVPVSSLSFGLTRRVPSHHLLPLAQPQYSVFPGRSALVHQCTSLLEN